SQNSSAFAGFFNSRCQSDRLDLISNAINGNPRDGHKPIAYASIVRRASNAAALRTPGMNAHPSPLPDFSVERTRRRTNRSDSDKAVFALTWRLLAPLVSGQGAVDRTRPRTSYADQRP